MAGETSKNEQGLEEETTMRMLFGEEFMGMADDGFEGSKAEHDIFMDVFNGNGPDGGSNCNDVSRTMNSGSIPSSHSSMEDPFCESSEPAKMSSGEKSGSKLLLESSPCFGLDAQNGKENKMEVSPVTQLNYRNRENGNCMLGTNDSLVELNASKVATNALMQDAFDAHQFTVEAYSQGILSIYHLSNEQLEIDGKTDYDDKVALDCNITRQDTGYGGKVGETNSCLLENSFAALQLPSSPLETPWPLQAWSKELLKDSGWRIDPRVRSDRAKLASYFTAPERAFVVTSLSHAWKSCGHILYESSPNSERDDMGRVWKDIHTFWGDLMDTIAYIEKKIKEPENFLSLWDRWQLLDPFMAVVCINKKVGVLRAGKTLRAVNSDTFVLSEKSNMILGGKNSEDRVDDSLISTILPTQELKSEPGKEEGLQHLHDSKKKRQCRHIKKKLCYCGEKHSELTKQETSVHELSIQASDRESNHAQLSVCSISCAIQQSGRKPFYFNEKVGLLHNKASLDDFHVDGLGQEGASACLRDDGFREDLLANETTANALIGFDETLRLKSSIYEENFSKGVLVSDIDSNVTADDERGIFFEEKLANSSVKRARKKSKKISEIEATGLNGVCGGNCIQISETNASGKLPCLECDTNGSNAKRLKSISKFHPNTPFLLKDQFKDAASEESLVVSDDSCIPTEEQSSRKVTKTKKSKNWKENGRKRPRGLHIYDDDLLITAIIKNKDFTSCSKFTSNSGYSELKTFRKLKTKKKKGCQLLLRTPGKGGKNSLDGKRLILGRKTVLCWLIARGVISLKDVVQYRDLKNNEVVKDGWVTVNGVLCNCCTKVLSVSEFKAHSDAKMQKSSLNLFLQSGKSYTLCQLEAWSAEYRARKSNTQIAEIEGLDDQNDDTCGLCGDGGELICCDSCPSTYHQDCLLSQELPEGNWYCHNCICRSCGVPVYGEEASTSSTILKCSQCEQKYHETCHKDHITCDGDVGSDTWFCGRNCLEVYLGLRSHVGVVNCLDDGYSWTILRCNHDEPKVKSAQKITLMAECNTKLAIALNIMEECFARMVDPRTGIDMIPHVLYNWGSSFARLNYQGFYTLILEKSDEVVSVASIRVHGNTVAELPFIATCSEYRRQGMCRRLMDAIEKMLRSFSVKMLVLSAIPDSVNTWTSGFGFKPMGNDEKKQLSNMNLMSFPGSSLLMKRLDETKAEESGMRKDLSVREDDLHVGGDHSQNLGNSYENQNTEFLLSMNMTSVELVDSQLENGQLFSHGSDISPKDTSNLDEFGFCPIQQIIEIQKVVEDNPSQIDQILSNTSAQNAGEKDESSFDPSGGLNSEGAESDIRAFSDASEQQGDKCFADKESEKINEQEIPLDGSSDTFKDELCGSAGWCHAAKVGSTGNTEA
uniref:Increased DNA methylation 1 n=1 Tax=Ananas comosus var. bracteatus TaxID=296719 RepID=A0A6V7Q6X4_ANACO|nr:unnamed protein product [Ananas comosus var. bracteatus]